ncbi:MAG TPA: anti-sigma factor [Gemmatimonadales bacterium]|nr:anti-sigma factor [Gemmatimonadales bacterium]
MTCAELDARLDGYLDGDLPPAEHVAVEKHLATCSACAALHTDLVALRERARAVPREVAPPPAVWAAVSNATLDHGPTLFAVRSSPVRFTPWGLAAAAALLVALSSAVTVGVLRNGGEQRTAHIEQRTLDPRLAALEADYQRATTELVRALEAEGALTPSVRLALDRHLAVVDGAIAEARASALQHPADPDAGGMLLAAYRQKLDLLERATRLGSET